MKNKKTKIPVLITWDVDPDRWATVEHRENALSLAMDLCEELGIRSTFFITANHIHEYPDHIARMHLLRQEIGCHGLMHTDEEDYDKISEEVQRSLIKEATKKIETVVGETISSFRSPRVKTSALTLKILSDFNYMTDSSICSQRMDFVSSNLINFGWLVAPRLPYHPHPSNPFRRGNLPILEIPISAAIIPFISSSLKVLGVRLMKAFIWLLYVEAKITGKPIVYLAHPTEFVGWPGQKSKLTLADFSPKRIRTHGFLARNLLFRLMGEELFDATREIFIYISKLPGVVFMTCNEFTTQLKQETGKRIR